MKITFFEAMPQERHVLRRLLKEHTLIFTKDVLTEKNAEKYADCDIVSVFVYSDVNKKVISRLKKLKLISTRSTGFDHIDVKFANLKKIKVCNVPYYGDNTVAEHAFALLLTICRKIYRIQLKTLQNDFSLKGLQGLDLKGKTLGVVGAGSIGLNVIKIARGFGMKVLVFDISKNDFLAETLGFEYTDLDYLYSHSDIISLHVPLNPHTKHMLNKEAFSKMKKGTILINTARGGIVDTDALIDALDNGIIGGAGLDVLEDEKFINEENQRLYETASVEVLRDIARARAVIAHDNVVFTPHMAFFTHEALERIVKTSAENILSFVSGKPLNEVVLKK